MKSSGPSLPSIPGVSGGPREACTANRSDSPDRLRNHGFSCFARSARAALTIAPVLLVSACATNENPAEGGFISGVAGATSGGYQERVDERQENVDELAKRDAELREKKSEAALEIEKNEAEISGLEAELGLLDQQIQYNLDRIASLDRALTDTEQQTVAQAKQVPGTGATAGGSGTDGRLESLRQSVLNARSLADRLAAIEAS